MKSFYLLTLASILLSACSTQSEADIQSRIDDAVAKKETEIRTEYETKQKESTEKADDLFQKNIDCQKYKSDIEKKFKDSGGDGEIWGVFFSPKVNSCLYAYLEFDIIDQKASTFAVIADVFTSTTYEQYVGEDMPWRMDAKIMEYSQE